MRSLILGGARSGKSAYAESLALQSDKQVIYLATAQAHDSEMQERILHHQTRRPGHWQIVEQPLLLAETLRQLDGKQNLILLDCLTLWLSNLLFADGRAYPEIGKIIPPDVFLQERAALLALLPQLQADIVLVSNEVGMGIVPLSALTRWFADEAGRLNQAVAALCERVVLVAAGLPLVLKTPAANGG